VTALLWNSKARRNSAIFQLPNGPFTHGVWKPVIPVAMHDESGSAIVSLFDLPQWTDIVNLLVCGCRRIHVLFRIRIGNRIFVRKAVDEDWQSLCVPAGVEYDLGARIFQSQGKSHGPLVTDRCIVQDLRCTSERHDLYLHAL